MQAEKDAFTFPSFMTFSRPLLCPLGILLLLGACLGCSSESSSPSDAPQYEETLRIGADSSGAPSHALFEQVTQVAVDDDGTLYVVDGRVSAIRVFDRQGAFLRSIGGEGAGPGEFQQITALHFDRHNRLLVADASQGRITAFSPQGELLSTYSFPDVPRITDVADLGNDRYVVVGSKDDRLVHVVDTSFTRVEASLLKTSSVKVTDRKVEDVVLQFFPGGVTAPSDSTILYAPAAYGGTLHAFTRQTDGSWSRTDPVEGLGRHDPPISIGTPDQLDRVDIPVRLDDKRLAVQLHAFSTGIYTGDDVVHVSVQENGGARDVIVEHFDAGLSLRNHTVVDTTSSLTEVLEVDDDGNLYLSTSTPFPMLKRLSPTRRQ
jgi:hypothetical protein